MRVLITTFRFSAAVWLKLFLAVSFVACSLPLQCQNPQRQVKYNSAFPAVTFSLANWSNNPNYYSIAIDSAGNVTYQSIPASVEKTGAPYVVQFPAAPSTCRKIFRLVEQLHFFREPLGKTRPLNKSAAAKRTATRTLGFHYGRNIDGKIIDNEIVYNSAAPGSRPVRQLTSLFQKISATLEIARRLVYFQQHDSRRVGTELQKLQAMARQGRLRALHAITPVLQNIASDAALDPPVRRRARMILSSISLRAAA